MEQMAARPVSHSEMSLREVGWGPVSDYAKARKKMVNRQIAGRGVCDPFVLAAIRAVPREKFLPEELRAFAYDDAPLPIAEGQTISQPYIVAVMIEAAALRPGDRALEIGTGSGYAAAVMAEITESVFTIERHASLAESALRRLRKLGYDTVEVRIGDGTLGLPEAAPFDVIVSAAGGPEIPASWKAQLAVGGRLVMPVGEREGVQQLIKLTRRDENVFDHQEIASVRFVPLVGAQGFVPQPTGTG